MDKLVAGLVVVIVVLAAVLGYMLYLNPIQTPVQNTQNTTQGTAQPKTISWKFTNAGTDEATQAPTSNVIATVNGREYALGTYLGSCFQVKGSQWQLLPGEIDGVICYFAGGGTEIGVFQENGKLVFKTAPTEEGGSETPSQRGNFSQVLLSL